MKATARCPRCREEEIGNLDHLVELSTPGERSYQALGVITYRQRLAQGADKGAAATTILSRGGETVTKAGTLEGYLCNSCGLLEEYLQDPQWFDLHQLDNASDEATMQRCPKCQHPEIARLEWLPDTAGSERRVVPRHLGTTKGGKDKLVGQLYGLVCAGCGYLETYVPEIEKVPLEELRGFSWHSKDDGSPYR